MKDNETFEELLNDTLDSWFDDLEESEQRQVLMELEAEDEEFCYLDTEKKYMVFGVSNYGLESQEECLTSIFTKAAGDHSNLSFAKEFIEDMVYHAQDYSSPLGFFQDLTHGCQSGMIGMLIYNESCKQIYIQNIDDMEELKENLEEELGDPIKNKSGVPHYTFLCWLCYEELGFSIARTLFPNEF